MALSIVEGYVPGCIGRIVALHAAYYSARHGFGLAFEAKVARELADFTETHRPGRDQLWLACSDGAVVGSIALDGAHAADEGAHLRWFITADAVRGQGVGRALLSKAVDFADACGYSSTYLWTFAGLDAARHLYEAHGFRLDREAPGSRWGTPVTEQRFVRTRP